MGWKLDLSGLTEDEAEHVLQVVQRDMKLRKKEEERLCDLKHELDEEGSRCLLLARQSRFNQRCCIRCCATFTFLLNPKRQCLDCQYNVCRACRVYHKRDQAWLCSACQKRRLLKTQSLEWFYTNVKCRFKRFGSAKVLKTLYRKHLAEHGTLPELTEGSACEESVDNEGSVCGSDSTFYRQSEEHSLSETLMVALRVAEEAIDEAISKAEFHTDSQEKQDEARYLQEHREELIEELAKTIVQKIINRRRGLAEMKPDCDLDWPPDHSTDPLHHKPPGSAASSGTLVCSQAPGPLNPQAKLWRSRSAFSLLDDSPEMNSSPDLDLLQGLKMEGVGSALSTWKSVDRLDNSAPSVLKSPDGNWIALQSTQLSRPSLFTRRKSEVFSALERESEVASAYERMSSDSNSLLEIHRKMNSSGYNLLRDSRDTRGHQPPHLVADRRGSRDALCSDSEGNPKHHKALLALLKKTVPQEIRRPSSSRRTSIIDVNFNSEGVESGRANKPEVVNKVRRSRKKRKSKKEQAPISTSVPEYSNMLLDALTKRSVKKGNQYECTSGAMSPDIITSGAESSEPFDLDRGAADPILSSMENELERGREDKGEEEERRDGDQGDDESLWKMDADVDEGRMDKGGGEEKRAEEEGGENEVSWYRLCGLASQSRVTQFSSTEDELDRAGRSEGGRGEEREVGVDEEENDGEREGEREELPFKLCKLERRAQANLFSSTEDELDRVGLGERDRERGGGEGGKREELASTLCRLAKQASVTQFSSTEDELDRVGRGEGEEAEEVEEEDEEEGSKREREEGVDDETLWRMEAEKAVQASHVRDLASLVSASQFSSTEDELDRIGENGGEEDRGETEEVESGTEMEELWFMTMEAEGLERNESMGSLDVRMFDFGYDVVLNGDEADAGEVLETDIAGRTREEEVVREAEHGNEKEDRQGQELEIEAGASTATRQTEAQRKNVLRTPEVERSDREDGGQRKAEGETKEASDSGERWDRAENEEVDEDFDEIFSSMLMLSLQESHALTLTDREKEERGEETEGEREEREEQSEGRMKGKEESEVDEREKEQQEPETDTSERTAPLNVEKEHIFDGTDTKTLMGLIARWEGKRVEVVEEEKEEDRKETEETRGERPEDEQVMERQGGVLGEGEECEKKETDETTKGTEEKHLEDPEETVSSDQEGILSPEEIQNDRDLELDKTIQFISTLLEQRYSAVSLRSITTEVLKVLNATEELLQDMEGVSPRSPAPSLPPNTDPKKLDQQFSRLEENVYVAAGTAYSLEAELGDLEECARDVSGATPDRELSFLEEQVASAAAKVQQSDMQISDISARIKALKNAGLNVDPQSRSAKARTIPIMPITLDSSRQRRRRLPAPPVKEKKTQADRQTGAI